MSLKTVSLNSIALRQAKIVYNFGLSECKRVKVCTKGDNFGDFLFASLDNLGRSGSIPQEKNKLLEEQIFSF